MEKFGIGRNVLSNILKNQKEMLATFDSIQTNSKAKCLKASKNEKMEKKNFMVGFVFLISLI